MELARQIATQFRLYALNALSRSAMAVSAPLRQLVLLPQAGQDQMLQRILCASDESLFDYSR